MLTGIAFIGSQSSGKSTTADALVRDLICLSTIDADAKVAFKRSFADALREEVANYFADSDYTADMLLLEMTTPGVKERWRPILQAWGELRRQVWGQDYWVNKWVKHLNRMSTEYDNNMIVTVDDCRYPNEYEMLRTLSFVFIRLESKPDHTPQLIGHTSEQHWPTFQYDMSINWIPLATRVELASAFVAGRNAAKSMKEKGIL